MSFPRRVPIGQGHRRVSPWPALCALILACTTRAVAAPQALFDGKTLEGWEGDTNVTWRVRDGVIVGGSMTGNPRNEFLATTRPYTNFVLRFEYRLVGTEGFVNGGVQFRSKRIQTPPNEMSGFQADIGAGYSGSLYDESRRNRFMAQADTNLIARIEKAGDWNRYEVEAIGPQIVLRLNGTRTAVWVETNATVEASGWIALQIHGGCKAEISFRNITVDEVSRPAIAPEAEVLGRFGDAQPSWPPGPFEGGTFGLGDGETVAFVGQENTVRHQKSGDLEALMAVAWADRKPRFRWMGWEADTVYEQWRDLNFGAWTPQLERAGATVVVAQFGQVEALDGTGRLPEFVAAYHRLLDQFALRTRRLVLVSPMPFERPLELEAPNLLRRNGDVAAYAEAVRGIARQRGAVFVDLVKALSGRGPEAARLTDDGMHLNDEGARVVAAAIAAELGARPPALAAPAMLRIRDEVAAKNRLWFDTWRPANWSFVYGDRVSQRFAQGSGNEPSLKQAFEQHKPMIAEAEARIHALALGREAAPAVPVAPLPPAASVDAGASSPEEELASFSPAEGLEVRLFASEHDGVVKPTQISWDERGRMYLACSPSYPHTRPGAAPADYVLVLEDTDGDGRADKSWKHVEGLKMVQGVEPSEDGVLVCDFDQILRFRDRDGDGRAEVRQVLFSGFGIGDTHQLVNSISHGPDGSLWFTQGLHAMSRVETPWGIARLDRAAVWRLQPRTLRLDGFFGGGMAGANCWGVAFDDFGQVFHKSGDRPHGYWTVPGMVRGASPIGSGSETSADQSYRMSPEQYHPLGALFDTSPKTTAIDIVGTRALPETLQGCALIAGYFGGVIEAHRFEDHGAGFKTTQLPKLLRSSDGAFRPVDVSVGPDGAIYVADWYNPVIGHYQASHADPKRDRTRGRIWRVSAKGMAPVRPPRLHGELAFDLVKHLGSPERWVRQQAKRLLFEAPKAVAVDAVDLWARGLDAGSPGVERLWLEAAGVREAHEAPDADTLKRLMNAKDARVRAYGARVAGKWSDRLPEAMAGLRQAAKDESPRVRLEAVVASTYAPGVEAVQVAMRALEAPRDGFLDYALRQAARALQPRWGPALAKGELRWEGTAGLAYLKELQGAAPARVHPGAAVYEMGCLPCHQPGGKGLPGVYPPLAGSEWVKGDPGRLVKIVLHGLEGPIQVAGQTYGAGAAAVPMPAMSGLTDEQVADVLSHVREAYGDGAAPVPVDLVRRLRAQAGERSAPWTVGELAR